MGTIETLMQIMGSIDEAVCFYNQNRVVTFWNRAAEELSGYPSAEAVGRNCQETAILHYPKEGEHVCASNCPVQFVMGRKAVFMHDYHLLHKNGQRLAVHAQFFPVIDDGGTVVGVFEVFKDNSILKVDRERLQEYIKFSYVDEETGLFNQRYFPSKVQGILEDMVKTEIQLGVIAVTVDNFFQVGREQGRSTASALINAVVTNLRKLFVHDQVIMFSWRLNRVVILLPNTHQTTMRAYPTNVEPLIKESGVLVGNKTVIPKVSLQWIVVDNRATPDGIAKKINEMFTAMGSK